MPAKMHTRPIYSALRAAAAACLVVSVAACAQYGATDKKTPGWFKTRIKEASKTPNLALVPALPPPGRDPAEWDKVQTDVQSAGVTLNQSPRSAEATQTAEQTAAFEEQARKEVESKRPVQ